MSVDYAALANKTKIEDITANTTNQYILQRLKDDDKGFDKLYILHTSIDNQDYDDYIPDKDEDLGWLGYYISNNTHLQVLNFYITITDESFYKEMSRNKSIKEICFNGNNTLDGNVFRMLAPFFKHNHNLTRIELDECEFGVNGARQLSLAIGSCNESLKCIDISYCDTIEGGLVDIITALSMHPQLELLHFYGMSIGRNECTALATLLRCTTNQLGVLNLKGNGIDDEGLDILVKALAQGNTLQILNLISNTSITINGWKKVATLLENPRCKLEKLDFGNSRVGDEGALVFANALKNNSTLKTLGLYGNGGVTAVGWAHFSKLLCDTSSIMNTYLSNHTLEDIGVRNDPTAPSGFVSSDDRKYLELNKSTCSTKEQIAMIKIQRVHTHFDMQSFFEWEFKVFPLMINWFAKAIALERNHPLLIYPVRINKMKLSATYEFIKAFPMLYIEPVTRKDIADYTHPFHGGTNHLFVVVSPRRSLMRYLCPNFNSPLEVFSALKAHDGDMRSRRVPLAAAMV